MVLLRGSRPVRTVTKGQITTMPSELRFPELRFLGWTVELEAAFLDHAEPGVTPARVARADRDRYTVLDETGERSAEPSGRLRHHAAGPGDLPAVGDWVVLRRHDDGPSPILALLPRRSAFTRKVPGAVTEEQILAAHLDTVFLVTGLDGNWNPRRIERYLTAAWESGARPVIVLSKADLAPDLDAFRSEADAVACGVPVVAVAVVADNGSGATQSGATVATGPTAPDDDASEVAAAHLLHPTVALSPWLLPGTTIALLGSSGVGKSTIVNALFGAERQAIGPVRAVDGKGRHTTTHRELVILPSGAILLDTPGMRELQLWGDESGLEGAFPDVAALATGCRFSDCRHETEPGCAVRAAVEEGRLEEERIEAWRKLERELAYLERRRDARAQSEAQRIWKQRSKSGRLLAELKRRS